MECPVDISDHNSKMETSFCGIVITTLLELLSEGRFQDLHQELQDKVKATALEGTTVKELFEGQYKSVISAGREAFSSLELDVRKCKDLCSCFDKYLEGDNGEKRGVSFTKFPTVLQLQLARFQYNESQDTIVKIHRRFEYPYEMDLDRENGKYLSTEADRSIRNLYTLYSVIANSSGVQDGKYFAIIRPTLTDVWFKLEDGAVKQVDFKSALDDTNAFMLIYIRESQKHTVMCNIDKNDIIEHVEKVVTHSLKKLDLMNHPDILDFINLEDDSSS